MAGSSWPVPVLGRKLALGFEFVAQVVEGVFLAVRMGAERGAGCGDQVVEVGQGAGQAAAEPADLGDSSGTMSSALASVPMAETALSCRLAPPEDRCPGGA